MKAGESMYVALHARIRRDFSKTGVCEECGEEVGATGKTGTHWAFLRHPLPHSENRDDYRELCPACHRRFDRSGKTDSPVTRARMSAAKKGRTLSPEHVAAISAGLKGKPKSPEHRAAISRARRKNMDAVLNGNTNQNVEEVMPLNLRSDEAGFTRP